MLCTSVVGRINTGEAVFTWYLLYCALLYSKITYCAVPRADFLPLVQRAIYRSPSGPYHSLGAAGPGPMEVEANHFVRATLGRAGCSLVGICAGDGLAPRVGPLISGDGPASLVGRGSCLNKYSGVLSLCAAGLALETGREIISRCARRACTVVWRNQTSGKSRLCYHALRRVGCINRRCQTAGPQYISRPALCP